MPRERTDAGTFAETVTLDAVRGVFDQVRGPVVTSSDVSDALDCTTEAARQKLQRLYDRGEVDKRKTGRTVVYWRAGLTGLDAPAGTGTADAESAESGREPVETPTAGQADRTDPPATSPATRPQDAGEIDATDATGPDPIGDALDGWEPDTDGNPRTARSQTRNAAEWLRSKGEYRRAGEFRDALAGDSTLAPRTWWDRHVRPGLNHLADAGLVEYTKNRGYRWVGDGADT